MDLNAPTPLLGGLSPALFMRRHWQRRPLLVRGAWPDVQAPLSRAALLALAERDDVESRLVCRDGARWSVRHGPLPRRSLPALKQPHWTVLIQGVDLHNEAAHQMLQRFRFASDARLDDLMISYASDGGGVGPHVDAYDVFLLQLQGKRRWRAGRVADRRFVADAPLKLLQKFEPSDEWLLEPGDMLYLPPEWGHDGVAQGACMTASIGFRSPSAGELLRALLPGLADLPWDGPAHQALYRDPRGEGTAQPARVASALQQFARTALLRATRSPRTLECALGHWLSEPKAHVWFERGHSIAEPGQQTLLLDRRTRMLYDTHHVYINGESLATTQRDAQWLRRLADTRELTPALWRRLSRPAQQAVRQWLANGWIHER